MHKRTLSLMDVMDNKKMKKDENYAEAKNFDSYLEFGKAKQSSENEN